MEFRLYNKPSCSFFDLIEGQNEPKQTKGLGLLLAKSHTALRHFLLMLNAMNRRNDINILPNTLLHDDVKCIIVNNHSKFPQ